MSAFKTIFRGVKDNSSPSSNKSSSSSSSQAKANNRPSSLSSSSKALSTRTSASSLQTIPAIDITNASATSSPLFGQFPQTHIPLLQSATYPNTTHTSTTHPNTTVYDPPSNHPNSNPNFMPRPSSSSGHSQLKGEPAARSSKITSKVEKSDDGHGKPELLNRHQLMRRAMAAAQDPIADDSSDEDRPQSQAASWAGSNYHGDSLSAAEEAHNRPGDGSLSIDHFGHGENHVIISDGSTSMPASNASSLNKKNATLTASPPKSIAFPNVIAPSPLRPDFPRPESLQEIVENQDNVYVTRIQKKSSFSSVQQQQQQHHVETEPLSRVSSHDPAGVSNSISTSSLLHPNRVSSDIPRNAKISESSSSPPLGSSAFLSRLRKNSDSGSDKANKSKSAADGIAGALLATSGMAGLGYATPLQQSQAHAMLAASASKSAKDPKSDTSSGYPDRRPSMTHPGGGLLPRDPSTGTIIERDVDTNFHHPVRDASVSSFISYDGSVMSDQSSASGLAAAAGFGATSAALLASVGGVSGMESTSTLFSPDGVNYVNGNSPSAAERNSMLDVNDSWAHEDVGPQITGFAVASSKRNNDFHQLFSQVPEGDYLIEDYGCALVREILIQGRLYISENHLCFNANIFGWVTNVVLPFSEIVSIEKRMTAFVIPNAIQIATLHSKRTFTSFLSRDTTYDLIVNIWKLSHPGVPLAVTDQADVSDEYSEMEDEADGASVGGGADIDTATGDKGDTGPATDPKDAKPSKRGRLKRKFKGTKTGIRDENLAAFAAAVARSGTPIISPPSRSPVPGTKRAPHRKTDCPCDKDKEHLVTVALDTTYPAVPEKIYNLIFTSGFMKEFWTTDQKLMDLQISDWSPNPQNNSMLSRNISYIKPLAGGFGPKQTKCLLIDENLHVDFDDYVVMLTSTRTPDVPSGGSFSIKTRTCISWAGGGNVSRVYVTCNVEWTGRSMIRSIIERASIEGQKQYYKDLDRSIRQYLQEHTSEFKEDGDDEAAVEEIARAATPGPNNVRAATKAASNEPMPSHESVDIAHHASTDDSSSHWFGLVQDGVGMVADLLGGAWEMVSELLSGSSENGAHGFSMARLFTWSVILMLLLSNIYTWKASSKQHAKDYATASRDGVDSSMREFNGYWVPYSPRYTRDSNSRDPSSAEAIAHAVRETLQDYFQPYGAAPVQRHPPPPPARSGNLQDTSDEIERYLQEAEARVRRLKNEMEELKQKRNQQQPHLGDGDGEPVESVQPKKKTIRDEL